MAGLSLLPVVHGLASPGVDRSYRVWAKGPERWLMLPEEERAFRRLRNDREAARFVAEFWHRRDPHPEQPGNSLLDRFRQRVEAADRLYAEGKVRGSLTERGRALLLLGPPTVVRLSQQSAPVWDPQRPARHRRYAVRQVSVESWHYRTEDLWPKLVDLLAADSGESSLTLTFVVEADRARLVEGEKCLRLAALASVRSID